MRISLTSGQVSSLIRWQHYEQPLCISQHFSLTVSSRKPRKRLHTLKARDIFQAHVATVGTTHMKGVIKGRTGSLPISQINQHGGTLAEVTTKNPEGNLPTISHDQPRASSPINDNYCFDKLQEGLLAGSPLSTPRQTMNTIVKSYANPKERNKSRVSRLLFSKRVQIKICERCFLCHSIVLCKTCNKCQKCCLKSACRARLQSYWQTWLNLGADPKVVQILREGYTLPFRIPPKLARSPTIISCYVNPHRNLYLLEALHQLIDKNAVELVDNPTIPSAQTQQHVETYTRSQQTKPFPQGRKIQNGDTKKPAGHPSSKGTGLPQ